MTGILEPAEVAAAAELANVLAPHAGDEAAVIGALVDYAERTDLETVRASLALLSVVMFARWLAPHTPGATVPVRIPTEGENTP